MKKRIGQIILTLIVFICICTIVLAENIDDLRNRKNELQNQLIDSNEQMQDIQIQLTENLEQINSLNEKILGYENDITILESDLEEVEKEIAKIESKLRIVEENYNLQRTALQNRIVALYESGDVLYLDVLLNSNSVSDFISNYFLIGEIARYDNNLLEDIENQKIQIENTKAILKEKELSIKTTKENKEKTTVALENAIIIRNSYISKLTKEEQETQKRIDEYQAELNILERQITALATQEAGFDYVGGEFLWPAPGYYTITSRFGIRVHPILKVVRNHSGTDIACPMGTNIIAANDGIVISSTYSTGYGNMIMIDHGGGVVTLYGHGSELIAEVGQTVKKGDIIMKSGSTGWSTGPHLHFEVRINGVAVDSLPYITGKATTTNTQNDMVNNTINNATNESQNIVADNNVVE